MLVMKLRLLALPFAALAFAGPGPVSGQHVNLPQVRERPSPPPAARATEAAEEPGVVLGTGEDRWARMTVPVKLGESGPYPFLVDTGAERTSIAEELAHDLKLGEGTRARLHSMTEVSSIQTVVIPALEVGGRRVRDINAPALERRYIGAEGILGVDSLQTQRVSFDFLRQQMTVTNGRRDEDRWPSDTIVVTARNRLGHLVLVDASVDGPKVWGILDTGAQTTVANNVLRRKLEKKGKLPPTWPIELQSVTGGRMAADQTTVKRIRIGGIDINDLPVAFADVHPFVKLGLTDRPALLLGMDALRLFDRVSVVAPHRRKRLLGRSTSEREGPSFAARARAPSPQGQIRSWLPSSTTRFVGNLKNSIALSELFIIHANSRSRHSAIPGCSLAGISFWRPRKKLVLIISKPSPHVSIRMRSAGMSTSSMKP
jgi:predicted aspartyl protease